MENLRPNTDNMETDYDWSTEFDMEMNEIDMNFIDDPDSRLFNCLRKTFKLDTFRNLQLDIIKAVLSNYDCLVLMATGKGKSLCYQLPAVISDGVTIVISPLKSLITDQITKLRTLGIKVEYLNSDLSYVETACILNNLMSSPGTCIKLLYITPEKVISEAFSKILNHLKASKQLARFVVDEAHCIIEWGFDFRPSYTKLELLKLKFPEIPIMLLTASSNISSRNEIIKILNLNPSTIKMFISSFNRSNIKYAVVKKIRPCRSFIVIRDLILNKYNNECGIIYFSTIKECKDFCEQLKNAGLNCDCYHSEISTHDKNLILNNFMENKIQIICATIAFGMGIDKPNIRFVIHHSIPNSMENYFQESGRAGRDGNSATSTIFYRASDAARIRSLTNNQKIEINLKAKKNALLNEIMNYCEQKILCRRKIILNYFNDTHSQQSNENECCDNCDNCNTFKSVDLTKEANIVINFIKLCKNQFTINYAIQLLKGSKNKRVIDKAMHHNEFYAKLADIKKDDVSTLIIKLITNKYLTENYNKNGLNKPLIYLDIGSKILLSSDKIFIDKDLKEFINNPNKKDNNIYEIDDENNLNLNWDDDDDIDIEYSMVNHSNNDNNKNSFWINKFNIFYENKEIDVNEINGSYMNQEEFNENHFKNYCEELYKIKHEYKISITNEDICKLASSTILNQDNFVKTIPLFDFNQTNIDKLISCCKSFAISRYLYNDAKNK